MQTIGINIAACKGIEMEEYVRIMKSLGFGATFSGCQRTGFAGVMRLAELCAKYGISYDMIHAPFRAINHMWFDTEAGEAMLHSMMQCVDECHDAAVGIAVVHMSSGIQAPSITDVGRARYERLVEYAARKNVKIAFENQRKLANLSWALETFGPDVAGFCWDCGHEQCFTPGREYMPLFGDRLICTHIHDNSGKFDCDEHKLPFDGILSEEYYARHMARSPYNGSLMLEVFATGDDAALSPYAYLEKAAKAARRLAAAVELARG